MPSSGRIASAPPRTRALRRWTGLAALVAGLLAAPALAAQDGVVAGTVVTDGTLQPIPDVQINVVGTPIGTRTDARYQNQVFAQNTRATTTVGTAYRNLTVQGLADPRVPVLNANQVAGDQTNQYWQQLKYASLTAPMRLTSGVEAQLILAEARGGADGVTVLNALRARTGVGLPALTGAEGAAFTSTLFEERRRALFLQGTRWYDIRRGNLPLVPAVGDTYPKGGTYGDQRCWPLPDVARLSNPNMPDAP